jgi:hypothetical protein
LPQHGRLANGRLGERAFTAFRVPRSRPAPCPARHQKGPPREPTTRLTVLQDLEQLIGGRWCGRRHSPPGVLPHRQRRGLCHVLLRSQRRVDVEVHGSVCRAVEARDVQRAPRVVGGLGRVAAVKPRRDGFGVRRTRKLSARQEGPGCPTSASELRAFRLAGSSGSSGRRTARCGASAVAEWACGVRSAADGVRRVSRPSGAAPADSAA